MARRVGVFLPFTANQPVNPSSIYDGIQAFRPLRGDELRQVRPVYPISDQYKWYLLESSLIYHQRESAVSEF